MTDPIDAEFALLDPEAARSALAGLPEGTSHGEFPAPEQVYLARSHLKAVDPDNMVVIGMRGAGKTFWWAALQRPAVRQFITRTETRSGLSENTVIRTGFGVTPAPHEYPDKDTLAALKSAGIESRIIWRAIQAWQMMYKGENDHPMRAMSSWRERIDHVDRNPEATARFFQEVDAKLDRDGVFLIVLFDALDRCSDDWKDMYDLIRGLMQTALEMRSYKRLRVKIFLRSDQFDESRIASFPDASKVTSSSVTLGWPPRELYGLLWQNLVNGSEGEGFRGFLGGSDLCSVEVENTRLYLVPRRLVASDEDQRRKFHAIAGQWMGRNAKRGLPYSWIPNHLSDAVGRVSPRSFLKALRAAAEHTTAHYPQHEHALHFDSIKSGVQVASKVRVAEIKEDFPWVHRVLETLEGMTVPCTFEEVAERWSAGSVLEQLREDVEQGDVRLPPLHLGDNANGIRRDLENLGIFRRLYDGRVNIPDVFRVGYGLGRKGGVKPAR